MRPDQRVQDQEAHDRRDCGCGHDHAHLVDAAGVVHGRGQDRQGRRGHAQRHADEDEADQLVAHGVAVGAQAEGEPAVGHGAKHRGGEHGHDIRDLGAQAQAQHKVQGGRERGAADADHDEPEDLLDQGPAASGQGRDGRRGCRHVPTLPRPPHGPVDAIFVTAVNLVAGP
jgi:hypothetical protein